MLPEFTDSGFSFGYSFLIGGAGVQYCLLAFPLNVSLPTVAAPANSLDARSVVVVQGAGSTSEVGHSVVQPLSIYVINLGGGLLSVVEEPSESVGENLLAPEGDVPVAVSGDSASFTTDDGIPVNLFDPSEYARVGTVFKVLTGFLWDNLFSHIKPSFDVVRGLVAPTTSTPILSRV